MLFVKDLRIFKPDSSNITDIEHKNLTYMDILFYPKYSNNLEKLVNQKLSPTYHYNRRNLNEH